LLTAPVSHSQTSLLQSKFEINAVPDALVAVRRHILNREPFLWKIVRSATPKVPLFALGSRHGYTTKESAVAFGVVAALAGAIALAVHFSPVIVPMLATVPWWGWGIIMAAIWSSAVTLNPRASLIRAINKVLFANAPEVAEKIMNHAILPHIYEIHSLADIADAQRLIRWMLDRRQHLRGSTDEEYEAYASQIWWGDVSGSYTAHIHNDPDDIDGLDEAVSYLEGQMDFSGRIRTAIAGKLALEKKLLRAVARTGVAMAILGIGAALAWVYSPSFHEWVGSSPLLERGLLAGGVAAIIYLIFSKLFPPSSGVASGGANPSGPQTSGDQPTISLQRVAEAA
jgi:hypothetical protein